MIISERMFSIMKEKKMTQVELSNRTGISTRTISDWRHKKTNPGSDKIMAICEALEITPEELLTGLGDPLHREGEAPARLPIDASAEEHLLEGFRGLSENFQRRLLAYLTMLQNTKEKMTDNTEKN